MCYLSPSFAPSFPPGLLSPGLALSCLRGKLAHLRVCVCVHVPMHAGFCACAYMCLCVCTLFTCALYALTCLCTHVPCACLCVDMTGCADMCLYVHVCAQVCAGIGGSCHRGGRATLHSGRWSGCRWNTKWSTCSGTQAPHAASIGELVWESLAVMSRKFPPVSLSLHTQNAQIHMEEQR